MSRERRIFEVRCFDLHQQVYSGASADTSRQEAVIVTPDFGKSLVALGSRSPPNEDRTDDTNKYNECDNCDNCGNPSANKASNIRLAIVQHCAY